MECHHDTLWTFHAIPPFFRGTPLMEFSRIPRKSVVWNGMPWCYFPQFVSCFVLALLVLFTFYVLNTKVPGPRLACPFCDSYNLQMVLWLVKPIKAEHAFNFCCKNSDDILIMHFPLYQTLPLTRMPMLWCG